MKFLTYRAAHGGPAPGVLLDDLATVVDLSTDWGSLLELIDGGASALDRARELQTRRDNTLPLTQLELLAPLPRPRSIRDCSVFEAHLKNANAAAIRAGRPGMEIPEVWYQQPVYYKGNRMSVIGPEADIVWPEFSNRIDYELEIAAVIGKAGRDISARDSAHEHIFGFMIFNDMSARDAQMIDMKGGLGPAKGKDFDTGNVFGPWLVTRDEVDCYALEMRACLNGEYIGGGSTAGMYYRWPQILAHISRGETLFPGEVIGSGTVGGGTTMEHGRQLQPGDLIEFSVTGLGTLRNRLVRPSSVTSPAATAATPA